MRCAITLAIKTCSQSSTIFFIFCFRFFHLQHLLLLLFLLCVSAYKYRIPYEPLIMLKSFGLTLNNAISYNDNQTKCPCDFITFIPHFLVSLFVAPNSSLSIYFPNSPSRLSITARILALSSAPISTNTFFRCLVKIYKPVPDLLSSISFSFRPRRPLHTHQLLNLPSIFQASVTMHV
jgi:hypothetical protein